MAEEKEQYWAWTGDELISLGAFESFAEADRRGWPKSFKIDDNLSSQFDNNEDEEDDE